MSNEDVKASAARVASFLAMRQASRGNQYMAAFDGVGLRMGDIQCLLSALESREKDAGWLPMVSAPLDGSEIEILIRHSSWWSAHKEGDGSAWQQACRGHWIDFNGGGWTWSGLAGTPVGWRPTKENPHA